MLTFFLLLTNIYKLSFLLISMRTEKVSLDGVRLRLESRLKNALLVGAREKLGLTLEEVSGQIGISSTSLCAYENLILYPGQVMQKKICDFYRNRNVFLYEPDVFPESLNSSKSDLKQKNGIPKGRLVNIYDVPEEKLSTNGSCVDEILENELLDKRAERLYEAISRLTERQQQVIKGLWGLEGTVASAKELAKKFDVTHHAIFQAENRALKKLREVMPAVEYNSIVKYAAELPVIRPDSEHYINFVRSVGVKRNSGR